LGIEDQKGHDMKFKWMEWVGVYYLCSVTIGLSAELGRPPELNGRASRGAQGVRWISNVKLNQAISSQVVNGVLQSAPQSAAKKAEVNSFRKRLTLRLPLGVQSNHQQGRGTPNKHGQYSTYGIKFYSWWYMTAGWVPWKLLRN
tara:strand:+ start:108 stop:539 length:432 start_codon:yes stop_codon:yes gene_type:complete